MQTLSRDGVSVVKERMVPPLNPIKIGSIKPSLEHPTFTERCFLRWGGDKSPGTDGAGSNLWFPSVVPGEFWALQESFPGRQSGSDHEPVETWLTVSAWASKSRWTWVPEPRGQWRAPIHLSSPYARPGDFTLETLPLTRLLFAEVTTMNAGLHFT